MSTAKQGGRAWSQQPCHTDMGGSGCVDWCMDHPPSSLLPMPTHSCTSLPPPSYLTTYAHIPHRLCSRTIPPPPTYITNVCHLHPHIRVRHCPLCHCPTHASSPPLTYLTASTPCMPPPPLISNITLHVKMILPAFSIGPVEVQDFERLVKAGLTNPPVVTWRLQCSQNKFITKKCTHTTNLDRHKAVARRSPKEPAH